jgi:hypothetical protein
MIERKQMLPKWVRFFSWVFLVFLASPISLIVGVFIGDMRYSLFGINYYGSSLRPLPLFIILTMTFHGIAAYGLLWSKRWGVNVGIACGLIGALLSMTGMISAFSRGQVHFEFSIIAQVLFLIALFNVRGKWLMLDEEKS